MCEQVADLIGATFYGMDERAGELMDDLVRNAADRAGDGRLPFPQRFGHGQSKTVFDRLLDNDGGGTLQSIDLQGAPWRQVEDDDIGITAYGLFNFFEDKCAFGIVASASACENQLAVDILSRELIRLHYADRIFQAIETGYLGDDGPRAIDAEFIAYLLHVTIVEFLVLLGERIDAGKEQILRDGQLTGE